MFTPSYSRAANGQFTTGGFTQAQINQMTKEAGQKLYAELLRLDPKGGEGWFDEETNVPARCTPAEINNILRARIAYLKEQAEIRAALDEAKREMQESRMERFEKVVGWEERNRAWVARLERAYESPMRHMTELANAYQLAAVILSRQIVNHLDA